MQYIVYDLGEKKKDTVLEITLSLATEIRLVDKMNMDLMKNQQKYNCFNKLVNVSPYRVKIPETRRWYLLIEPQVGLKHAVKSIQPTG